MLGVTLPERDADQYYKRAIGYLQVSDPLSAYVMSVDTDDLVDAHLIARLFPSNRLYAAAVFRISLSKNCGIICCVAARLAGDGMQCGSTPTCVVLTACSEAVS